MATTESCEICDELTGGRRGLALWPRLAGVNRADRVVAGNDEFTAIVSAGPLIRGHCLILPRIHRSSMAATAHGAAHAMLSMVRDRLFRAYQRPVWFFEHGAPEGGDHRPCSVAHAHWHLLPAPVGPEALLVDGYEWRSSASPFVEAHREYLLVGDGDGRNWVAYSDEPIPSQALRRRAAQLLGVPEYWDWRGKTSVDVMLATLDDLRP